MYHNPDDGSTEPRREEYTESIEYREYASEQRREGYQEPERPSVMPVESWREAKVIPGRDPIARLQPWKLWLVVAAILGSAVFGGMAVKGMQEVGAAPEPYRQISTQCQHQNRHDGFFQHRQHQDSSYDQNGQDWGTYYHHR